MLVLIFRWILGVFFIIAGFLHFKNPGFFLKLMPLWMPLHKELVLLSGVTEIIGGVLLLIPATARLGAQFIILQLVAFLIVHIDMIIHHERFGEISLERLWIRLALQAPLIAWAYFVMPKK